MSRLRLLMVASAAAIVAAAGAVALTRAQSADRGATWLAGQSIATAGQQADAIVALSAAGRTRSSLTGRVATLATIAPSYATGAGSAGKIVLAAVSAGANPRSLGGVDYVARIRATYRDGRYGSGTYDQAYALLALAAAHEPIPRLALRRATAARGTGGWGFRLNRQGSDDISATGIMIQALRAAGLSRSHGGLRSATTWMVSRRNAAGAWAIDGGRRPTEANATAIAICALRAMGHPRPTRAIRALQALQASDGGFRFTRAAAGSRLIATLDAVVALAGRTLPVR